MALRSSVPPERRVTIRDIAVATGLHFTTVSLALRGSPMLRAETREKVQAVAKELGYKRDPMLTALNAYCRSKRVPKFQAVIAWINNWPDRYALQRIPGFREYYRGALERAEHLGYVLEEFWLREKGITPARLVRILKARNIRALLLAPQPQAHTPPPIDYDDFSVVCFGYSMQPAILHVITNHHFHSINLLMAKVMELGYTRIGLCVGMDWDDKCEHAWLGGLMMTLAKNPQLVDIPPFGGDFGDLREFKRWLAKYKPEVVISSNEFLNTLREIGCDVPGEIGFASVAVDPRDEKISGIYQNDFLIGQKAVDLLVDMIHRDERGVPAVPIRTLVESVWVPGQTLLPRRRSKTSVSSNRTSRTIRRQADKTERVPATHAK